MYTRKGMFRWVLFALAGLMSVGACGPRGSGAASTARPRSGPRHQSSTELPFYSSKIQLHRKYLIRIVKIVRSIPGCKLLVWGVGYDSKLWCTVNRGGTTIFLEDHPKWARMIAKEITCPIVKVSYSTRLEQAQSLLRDEPRLQLALPAKIQKLRFDVILVDGPDGSKPGTAGRMVSIYMSSRLSHDNSHVFVHDYHRPVETLYGERFLTPRFGAPVIGKHRAWLAHFHRQRR
ncbi:MAG: hypothetical protein ABI333_27000 [bacterium]